MLRRYTSLYTQQISTHSCITLFLGMASRIQLYCADDVASFSLSRLHVDALSRYDNARFIVAHNAWMTRSYVTLPAVTRIASAALACLALAHADVLAERAADHMLARSLRRVRLGRCDAAGWVFPASYESMMAMLHEKHTDT